MMSKREGADRVYTADDLDACGFAIKRLFGQLYPGGLTGAQIREKAKSSGWMRRVYDLVVVKSGV